VTEAGKELASSSGGRCVLVIAEELMLEKGLVQNEMTPADFGCIS